MGLPLAAPRRKRRDRSASGIAIVLAEAGSHLATQCHHVISLLFAKGQSEAIVPALMKVLTAIERHPTISAQPPIIEPWLTEAMAMLRTSACAMKISAVAEQVGVSEAHLSRRMKQAIGMSPHAWHVVARVELAKSALRQGCIIREAASAGGFTDASSFTRAFARATGLSPRRFKSRL